MRFLVLFTLMSSLAHAGTLENRRTGETIDFNLSRRHKVLSIDSMSNFIISGNYQMETIEPDDERVDLLAANHLASDWYDDMDIPQDHGGFVAMSILLPPINIPRLGAIVYDAILLPFKAPVALAQTIKSKNDHKKLLRAITGNKIIKVSNGRFNRIGKLLENTFID